jgi:aspartyl-tRNA(Asn)/glutamyl-tRNA(Gln) amidotransferase subunit C
MPPVIDQAEVRRIARLARLKLSEQEVRLFTGQLARILEYVKQIESLNTTGVEPLAHALPVTNVLREGARCRARLLSRAGGS